MCTEVHSRHGYKDHDSQCCIKTLKSLPQSPILNNDSKCDDYRKPAVSTGIAVLLWTIESNRLNVLVVPEGSGVGVEGFQQTCKERIEQQEHDSNKSSILVSDDDQECESSKQNNNRVYQQSECIEEDIQRDCLVLLK